MQWPAFQTSFNHIIQQWPTRGYCRRGHGSYHILILKPPAHFIKVSLKKSKSCDSNWMDAYMYFTLLVDGFPFLLPCLKNFPCGLYWEQSISTDIWLLLTFTFHIPTRQTLNGESKLLIKRRQFRIQAYLSCLAFEWNALGHCKTHHIVSFLVFACLRNCAHIQAIVVAPLPESIWNNGTRFARMPVKGQVQGWYHSEKLHNKNFSGNSIVPLATLLVWLAYFRKMNINFAKQTEKQENFLTFPKFSQASHVLWNFKAFRVDWHLSSAIAKVIKLAFTRVWLAKTKRICRIQSEFSLHPLYNARPMQENI